MKVYEGTIITCDDNDTVAKYLVEDEGRIVYVGDDLPDQYGSADILPLGQRALVPSFADTHMHFASFATFNAGLNVMDAKSNAEIQKRLREFLKTDKAKIAIAFGASPYSVSDGRLISREELDEASGDRPVFFVKYDGHACVVNTALLNLVKEKVKDLRGYHEDTGEMNQDAFFAVSDYITAAIPIPALIKNMQSAMDYLATKGIGMVHTVSGVGFTGDLDVDMERFVARGAESGFQIRVFMQSMTPEKVIKRKLPRIGGCFACALDGCFGSMDAAMKEPYEGTQDSGVLYHTDEQVTEFCKKANRAGLQIEMHAIGDAAFDQATRALKAALDDFPREDHRHGIIHDCLPTEEGIRICKDYHIQMPIQTSFINWPQEPDAYLEKILGADRNRRLNPVGDFVGNGIVVSAGSDAPCTDPDPMLWIHNAVNHPVEGQSISVYEALRMCTYNGYYATFDEKERGSLEVGKIADMVILSENPYGVAKEKLRTIETEQLFLAGKPYQKQTKSVPGLIFSGMLSKRKC
ncbi:MAG: amidohydrolase family protein [Lachnospiraceae bacterium]|nr:amidohydrolase family protein [Lachnospiraceae bacterium]